MTNEGRDKGKIFYITEMPASQAERWAMRAILALAKSGVDLPEDIASLGMGGLAAVGVRALAGLRYEDAGPLLDEMMSCVQYTPDPAKRHFHRPLIENGTEGDDIEEVITRVELRREVLELHMGFSLPGARSNSVQTPASAGSSPVIPTSHAHRAR